MPEPAMLEAENDLAHKTVQFIINSELANEVLAVFGVPLPDAAETRRRGEFEKRRKAG